MGGSAINTWKNIQKDGREEEWGEKKAGKDRVRKRRDGAEQIRLDEGKCCQSQRVAFRHSWKPTHLQLMHRTPILLLKLPSDGSVSNNLPSDVVPGYLWPVCEHLGGGLLAPAALLLRNSSSVSAGAPTVGGRGPIFQLNEDGSLKRRLAFLPAVSELFCGVSFLTSRRANGLPRPEESPRRLPPQPEEDGDETAPLSETAERRLRGPGAAFGVPRPRIALLAVSTQKGQKHFITNSVVSTGAGQEPLAELCLLLRPEQHAKLKQQVIKFIISCKNDFHELLRGHVPESWELTISWALYIPSHRTVDSSLRF